MDVALASKTARHLDDRLQQLLVRLLACERRCGYRGLERFIGHSGLLSRVGGGEAKHALELKRGQAGMLGQDQGADPGHVGSGEAVARGVQAAAPAPRHLDIEPASVELDRGVGVVVEAQRSASSWLPTEITEENRQGSSRPSCCARGHDCGPAIRAVGELVEEREQLALGGGQAHVDELVARLDRPMQSCQQRAATAPVGRTEHAGAGDRAVGSQRADDPRAGGAVAEDIALRIFDQLGDSSSSVTTATERSILPTRG